MTEDESGTRLPYRGEIWRKALHLLSLSIPIGLLLFGRQTALVILVPLAAAFVVSEILRSRFAGVRNFISKVFGFMMRPEENPSAPSSVHFNGATWVLLSACVVIALFEPRIAAAALIIGLIGDAAAALIGRRFGRHRIGKRGKSIEGSLAFAVAALLAVYPVPGIALPSAAAAVVVAAIVEGIGGPVNDNLSVPLAAGIVLTFI
ncbi:MAG: phosphatidate cytidylyltransferase [Rhodothermales bacterium]